MIGLAWCFRLEHRTPLPPAVLAPLQGLVVQVHGAVLAPNPRGYLLTLRLAFRLRHAAGRHTARLQVERMLAAGEPPPPRWAAQVLGYHVETGTAGRWLAVGLHLEGVPLPAVPRAVVGLRTEARAAPALTLNGSLLAEGTLLVDATWVAGDGTLRCSAERAPWRCLLPMPGCCPADSVEVRAAVAGAPWRWTPGEATVAVRALIAIEALVLRREASYDPRGELLVQRVVGRAQGSVQVGLAIPLAGV